MRLGVVADDVTGSNDIGSMFAKHGYRVYVLSLDPRSRQFPAYNAVDADVIILNTNSRLDDPALAYRKVFEATRNLQAHGCGQVYKKTCSVFRGNIGAELDALLDALGLAFAVVVLGFPKNGRTTVDGIHYVHGLRLEESEFRNDPIHPMRQSDLVQILQAQTRRRVGRIGWQVVRQGAAALRAAIDEQRAHCDCVILDVPDQPALQTIAAAVQDEPVLCGSSALGEELPPLWGPGSLPPRQLALEQRSGLGGLVVAGSLMPQTAAQVDYLQARGALAFTLDSTLLIDPVQAGEQVQRAAAALSEQVSLGRNVILQSPRDPDVIARTRQAGRARGLDVQQVARVVSGALADCTARILRATGQNRLVVAGGETSDAVCERLGIFGMWVWQEIQPGVPSCQSLTEPAYLLVLKSGSFGRVDFLEQALAHLRGADRTGV